jgi:flagellar protein FlaG
MRIGDATTETGGKPQRSVVEDRPAVQIPQASVEVERPHKEAKPSPPIEVPKIESVTKQIDSFLRSIGRTISFRVDPGSGRTVVSVLDTTTGEVIRQVPGEDALRLAQSIEDSLSAFVDEHA